MECKDSYVYRTCPLFREDEGMMLDDDDADTEQLAKIGGENGANSTGEKDTT